MSKLFFLLLLLTSSFLHGQTGTIVVQVTGVVAAKGGEVSAGLFRKGDFPKIGKQLTGTVQAVKGNSITLVLSNIAVGEYALAVFQDFDKNRVLKTNLVGYPTEPVGFSNNAKMIFGPPSFEEARFQVKANQTTNLAVVLK